MGGWLGESWRRERNDVLACLFECIVYRTGHERVRVRVEDFVRGAEPS